jgi:uncharacterized protein YlxP (DUF503 family)
MVIGFLCLEIHYPYSQSLKEKRKALNSLKDRIRQKHNVAVAELDYQDTWQRTKIGVVTLNSQKSIVEQLLQKILLDAEQNAMGVVTSSQIDYF